MSPKKIILVVKIYFQLFGKDFIVSGKSNMFDIEENLLRNFFDALTIQSEFSNLRKLSYV